jgi:nucleoside-diphosphate-sugar epimerase
MAEDEYVRANRELSQIVLDALDPIGAVAVFVASSGAARFADDASASQAMRLYGSLKRADEEAFAAWAERQGRRAVIARIFAISGRHINKHGVYALASFILDALAKRPIRIRAPHRVVRAYSAVGELISLVFALLTDGKRSVTRFDTGGEAMEMRAVAERIAALLGPVPIERPGLSDAPADTYVGESEPYQLLLNEHGVRPICFDEQVLETARFLAGPEESAAGA